MSLPTTQQVNNYLMTQDQPVSSKTIAKHLGCTTKDVNRSRDGYIGIYKNPDISSDNFMHTWVGGVNEPEPVPEPVTEPVINPPEECSVCLEELVRFPISWGCCTAKMCSRCATQICSRDDTPRCPVCRSRPPFIQAIEGIEPITPPPSPRVAVANVHEALMTQLRARLQARNERTRVTAILRN